MGCIPSDGMSDIILEILRAIIVFFLFVFLLFSSGNVSAKVKGGWKVIIFGFGLLLFASIIDVTDNFEFLDKFLVIGDTPGQAFLEKVVGYLGGFLLLAIGFWKWLPKVLKLDLTKEELEIAKTELKESNLKLEEKVIERTKSLSKSEQELREKNKELEEMNKNMTGRELKMIELKKKISELEKGI